MAPLTANQRKILASGSAAVVLILAASATLETRLIVWNTTASVPRGLYARASGPPARGDYVLFWMPSEARALAAERHYLPTSVPALKPVAAMAGDEVCAHAERVSINGAPPSARASIDHQGRPMPAWEGCRVLREDEVFVFSTYAADSFDGRYFGPSAFTDVIEKVVPLWTFP